MRRAWGGYPRSNDGRSSDQYWRRAATSCSPLDNRGSAAPRRRLRDGVAPTHGRGRSRGPGRGRRLASAAAVGRPARIGVFGWSYGGYMTLMLLATAPDVFRGRRRGRAGDRLGAVRHPLHRALPRDARGNAEGYDASGVFAHADGCKPPLLLVHGMADDNVLFTNSTQLMTTLQDARQAVRPDDLPGRQARPAAACGHRPARVRDDQALSRRAPPAGRRAR